MASRPFSRPRPVFSYISVPNPNFGFRIICVFIHFWYATQTLGSESYVFSYTFGPQPKIWVPNHMCFTTLWVPNPKFGFRTQTWFATRSTQNPIWVPVPRLAIKILKGHNPKTQIAIFRTTCNKPGAGKDRNQIGCEPTHSTTHRYIVPGPRAQTGCLTDILSSPPAPGVSHRHPLLTPRPPPRPPPLRL